MHKNLLLSLVFVVTLPLVTLCGNDKGETFSLGKHERSEEENALIKNANELLEAARKKQKLKSFTEKKTNGKKNDDCFCAVCKEPLSTHPNIVVHKTKIPHAFHAHCIVPWMRKNEGLPHLFEDAGPDLTIQEDEKITEQEDTKSNEPNEPVNLVIPCFLCPGYGNTKIIEVINSNKRKTHCGFSIKTSALKKEYLAYFDALPLEKKFFYLDQLPIKIALETLRTYKALPENKKSEICSPEESDIIIQKFLIKKATLWEESGERAYTSLDKYLEAVICQALELIKNRPITLEYARMIIQFENLLDEKEKISIFSEAMKNKLLLMPCGDLTHQEKKDFTNYLDAKCFKKSDGINEKILEKRKHRAQVLLLKHALNLFDDEDQETKYKELLKSAPDPEEKLFTINKIVPNFSAKNLQKYFDKPEYKLLNLEAKTSMLGNFAQLTKNKNQSWLIKKIYETIVSYFEKIDTNTPEGKKQFKRLCKKFYRKFDEFLGPDNHTIIFCRLVALDNFKAIGETLTKMFESTQQAKIDEIEKSFQYMIYYIIGQESNPKNCAKMFCDIFTYPYQYDKLFFSKLYKKTLQSTACSDGLRTSIYKQLHQFS